MTKLASPHLKSLIFDSLLASFWRKQALQRFVRACGVSAGFASTLGAEETKRAFLERMFQELERHPKATEFFLELAQALAEQSAFPDLLGWEDSDAKVKAAAQAVQNLRTHLRSAGLDTDTRTRVARGNAKEKSLREANEEQRRRLDDLRTQLNQLATAVGTAKAGYEFQTWFYQLMAFHEIVARHPYVTDGRQIVSAARTPP